MNYTPSEKKIIEQKFDSYVKTCCRNETRNLHNYETRILNNEKPVSSFDSFEHLAVASEIEIPDYKIKGNDVSISDISLLAALEKIKPYERELILLKYFMEFTDEEISNELSICRRTVCDKRNKIINKLKKYMEE